MLGSLERDDQQVTKVILSLNAQDSMIIFIEKLSLGPSVINCGLMRI